LSKASVGGLTGDTLAYKANAERGPASTLCAVACGRPKDSWARQPWPRVRLSLSKRCRPPSRRRTITLRDGARATLRPIAPEDKPLIAATFERRSEESRYRRFFTTKNELSAAELAYLVDVDHTDHEAIIAIDPSNGEALGVARYIRFKDDAEVAEVAVTVADDWQRRGLGRALLDRWTYHARREGVRRFSALVQGDNPGALGLREGVGDTRQQRDSGVVELVIELPPKRGMGAQLAGAASGGCRKSGPGKDTRPPRRRRRRVIAAPTRATWSPDPDDCGRHGRLGDGCEGSRRRAVAQPGPGDRAPRGARLRSPPGTLRRRGRTTGSDASRGS